MGCGGKIFTINAHLNYSNVTMPIVRSHMLCQTCFLQCGPVLYPAYCFLWSNRPAVCGMNITVVVACNWCMFLQLHDLTTDSSVSMKTRFLSGSVNGSRI